MDKLYHINFLTKSFRLSENVLFLLIFGQFLEFGGVACVWWYMGFQKLSHQFLLILLMVVYPPIFITSLLQCGNPVFIAFPAFFRKMLYYLIVYKGKILVSKKVTNITKTKNDTCQLQFSVPTSPKFLVTIRCYLIQRPVFVSTPA